MVRFITDSASDMIRGDRENVTVLPMTITFGETSYADGVDLSHTEFYEKLVESDNLPTTSQIPPAVFEDAFQEVKDAGDQAVVVLMSAKLSGTYQSACIAAEDFEGTIYVVDSQHVTLGERCLIEYGLELREQGLSAAEIAQKLNEEKKHIRLVALLDTLEYLKKGGRISRTVAFAGGLLSIKPVVSIENGEVNVIGKARGSKHGNNLLVQEIHKCGGVDFDRPYFLGYTGLSDALLQKYIKDSAALWEGNVDHLEFYSVGGTIGTHSGPGAVAVAFFANEK